VRSVGPEDAASRDALAEALASFAKWGAPVWSAPAATRAMAAPDAVARLDAARSAGDGTAGAGADVSVLMSGDACAAILAAGGGSDAASADPELVAVLARECDRDLMATLGVAGEPLPLLWTASFAARADGRRALAALDCGAVPATADVAVANLVGRQAIAALVAPPRRRRRRPPPSQMREFERNAAEQPDGCGDLGCGDTSVLEPIPCMPRNRRTVDEDDLAVDAGCMGCACNFNRFY